MNVQFAIQQDPAAVLAAGSSGAATDGTVYVLEVNPRASRTVPFVSKATGVPLAKVAARCMVGRSLADQGVTAGSDAASTFRSRKRYFRSSSSREWTPSSGRK